MVEEIMITESRNAIVTGGVQGIGRAIVDALKKRGDEVTVFDCVSPQDARVLVLCDQAVSYVQVDIASYDSLAAGFNHYFNSVCPNNRLDILVNNAAVTRDTLALRMSQEQWDDVLNVNLKGLFFACQHALKNMIRAKSGYIINMSSVVGLGGNPGQAQYAASKAGVISLTKTLAYEYGKRNILINAIAPGFIATPLTDRLSEDMKVSIKTRIALDRFGEARNIADLVLFLSSGKADYITGQVLCIDGGLH